MFYVFNKYIIYFNNKKGDYLRNDQLRNSYNSICNRHGWLDAVNKTAKTLAANPDENYKSIARQSDKAICQFPVISSNAMTYDTAIMVTKACERNFTSFMQVVVGLNSVIDSGTTATQYISPVSIQISIMMERLEQRLVLYKHLHLKY